MLPEDLEATSVEIKGVFKISLEVLCYLIRDFIYFQCFFSSWKAAVSQDGYARTNSYTWRSTWSAGTQGK